VLDRQQIDVSIGSILGPGVCGSQAGIAGEAPGDGERDSPVDFKQAAGGNTTDDTEGARLFHANQFAEAASFFERLARRLSANDESTRTLLANTCFNLGTCYLGLWTRSELGEEATDPGLLKQAEAAFLRSIELRSDYTPAYVGLGAALYRQGRRPEALGAFATTLRSTYEGIPPQYVRVILGPMLTGIWKDLNASAQDQKSGFIGVATEIARLRRDLIDEVGVTRAAGVLKSDEIVESILPELGQMTPGVRERFARALFDAGLISAGDAVRALLRAGSASGQNGTGIEDADDADEFDRLLDALTHTLERAGVTVETLEADLPEARRRIFAKYYPEIARHLDEEREADER
jgi:tetratricopeptide (TPR) repeat protein